MSQSDLKTEQLIEWLDRKPLAQTGYYSPNESAVMVEAIRAKLLAAEEMAKALKRYQSGFVSDMDIEKALTAYREAGK